MLHNRTYLVVVAALLMIWGSACNAMRATEACDPSDHSACVAGQVCDEELGICVAPEDAVACEPASENLDCAVGQRCEPATNTCVDDSYVVVVVGRRDDPLIVRRAMTLIEFTALPVVQSGRTMSKRAIP